MEITQLTLKIIILLVPGGISCMIIEALTIQNKSWSPFRFISYSILSGAICYLIIQLIWNFFNWGDLEVWGNIAIDSNIPFKEVASASVISIFIGILLSGIIQHKLLFKLAKILNVSSKYGDDSLYIHFLNSKEIDEIYIRDIKNNLTYHGIIDSYSEQDEEKEIVIRNVTVYRYSDSVELYSIPRFYMNFHKEEIKIESIIKKK